MRLVATEKETQRSILQYLHLKGYLCFRNNSGATPFPKKGGGNYWVKFGLTGSGDILGMTKVGRFFSIEVKAKGKKPSPIQIEFMNAVNKNQGLAFVAYSVEDVAKYL